VKEKMTRGGVILDSFPSFLKWKLVICKRLFLNNH